VAWPTETLVRRGEPQPKPSVARLDRWIIGSPSLCLTSSASRFPGETWFGSPAVLMIHVPTAGTHRSVSDGSITTAGEGIRYQSPHHLTILLTQNDGIIRAHWGLSNCGRIPSATQIFGFLRRTNRARAMSMKANTFGVSAIQKNGAVITAA
jgi:hypothetical protein